MLGQTNLVLPWSCTLEAELKPKKWVFFSLPFFLPPSPSLFLANCWSGYGSHYHSMKLGCCPRPRGVKMSLLEGLFLLCYSGSSASGGGLESFVSHSSGSNCFRALSGTTKHTRCLASFHIFFVFYFQRLP